MDGLGIIGRAFEAAVKRLAGKTPVASRLRSREWLETVPLALRERAQLSAAVNELEIMQGIQDKLMDWVTLGSENPERALMGKGKFIAEMRQALGAEEGDTGDITDITSERRLGLIWDFQTQDAMEYGRWKMGQDEDVLEAYPAQEFVRVERRMEPRLNWPARWLEAGGRMIGGRMVALKGDPVWERLSVFGRPWPPFDFGSGMGVRDVGRIEAERLGLVEAGKKVEGGEMAFNEKLEMSVADLSEDTREELKRVFGDQVVITGDAVRWKG